MNDRQRITLPIFLCAILICIQAIQAQDDGFVDGDDAAVVDPLTKSPLLNTPETPEELLNAVRLMMKLGQLDVAKRYLELLIDSNPDPEALLKLRDKFGPGEFLRIAATRELRPLSSDLLSRVNAAFREYGMDETRIMDTIKDLSADPRKREAAVVSLRESGPNVIPVMVTALSSPDLEELHEPITYALIRQGKTAVPALMAAMNSKEPSVRIGATAALGYIKDRRAIPVLLTPAFRSGIDPAARDAARTALARIGGSIPTSARPAALTLRELAIKHYRGESDWELTADGNVELWTWDQARNTVAAVTTTPELASLFTASQYAAQAVRLAPGDEDLQSVFVSTSMAYEAARSGWQQAIPTGKGTALDLALTTGEDISMQALDLALAAESDHGARAALQALGNFATVSSKTTGPSEQPIVSALDFPNRRVQFAAANALLTRGITPNSQTANRLVEILSRALTDSGRDSVLVIDQNQTRGQTVGAQMASFGFDAVARVTSREGFKLATTRNDIVMVLVNANCQQWSLSDFVRNFRADSRTANIPIAVFGPPTARVSTKSLIKKNSQMIFVEEAKTADTMVLTLRPFVEKTGNSLSATERAQHRRLAAWWLASIARNRGSKFNLTKAQPALFAATNSQSLAADSMAALESIATATTQTQFLDIVSSLDRDANVRELAALHLAAHVQKHGMMLNGEQRKAINTLRDEAPNPGIASALASVLGAVQPNSQTIQQRLEGFTLPGL